MHVAFQNYTITLCTHISGDAIISISPWAGALNYMLLLKQLYLNVIYLRQLDQQLM